MRWVPYLGGRPYMTSPSDERTWRWLAITIAVLVTAGLALLSSLAYLEGRGEVGQVREDHRSTLLFVCLSYAFIVMCLTAAFREALFEDPLLDVFLVAPLTERRVFWQLWLQMLMTGSFGLAVCGPIWGWLLGRGAPLWLYPATVAAVFLGIVAGFAVAAVLAQLGRWTGIVVIAAGMGSLPFSDPSWPLKKLAIFGWHPVTATIVTLLVANAALLATADVLARLTYTHERLARLRGQARGNKGGKKKAKDRVPEPPRLARWLFRRLDRSTHARWRLLQGDEHPEAFVRYLPMLVVGYAVAAWLGWALFAKLRLVEESGAETPVDADFFLLLPFVVPCVPGLFIFLYPSTLGSFSGARNRMMRRLAETQVQPWAPVVYHEIFPVRIAAYLHTFFLSMAGPWTLMLLVATPFALALVGIRWLSLAALLWVGGLMLIGLSLHASVPRFDPRRDPSPTRLYVAVAVVTALGLAGFWLVADWVAAEDRYVRIAVWTREVAAPLFTGPGLASAVLLLMALELRSIRRLLARHRKRWFDVLP